MVGVKNGEYIKYPLEDLETEEIIRKIVRAIKKAYDIRIYEDKHTLTVYDKDGNIIVSYFVDQIHIKE